MGFDVADMGRRYSLDYGKGENGKGRINKLVKGRFIHLKIILTNL